MFLGAIYDRPGWKFACYLIFGFYQGLLSHFLHRSTQHHNRWRLFQYLRVFKHLYTRSTSFLSLMFIFWLFGRYEWWFWGIRLVWVILYSHSLWHYISYLITFPVILLLILLVNLSTKSTHFQISLFGIFILSLISNLNLFRWWGLFRFFGWQTFCCLFRRRFTSWSGARPGSSRSTTASFHFWIL